jgi:transposase
MPEPTENKWPYPFPREDWEQAPASIKAYLLSVEQRLKQLEERINRNSNNSSQPPSSDSPYVKRTSSAQKPHGKPGGKKGHKGSRQQFLAPTEVKQLHPVQCGCGNREFLNPKIYYTHQHLELPEIPMNVTHFELFKGKCSCCGKINIPIIPREFSTGYGPRLTAFIAELAGSHGDSRTMVQNLCASVFKFSISLGAIQKVLDRTSEAILPHYETIGEQARRQAVNHVDETSWYLKGVLCWLWVLTSSSVSFFMIHSNRSKVAFKELVKDWEGILVSDGYRLYTKWVGLRQTCLAHLIRDAQKLAESTDEEIAKFGKNALAELRRLCHMAHEPPTTGEWRAFYARFIKLVTRNHAKKNAAGKFAARLIREMNSLWVFLEQAGVSPTNNHAERMLRFAVCWRKRSYGNVSDKGCRWTERILSVRQTCRLKNTKTFPVLVNAIDSHFKGVTPDLSWIAQG